MKRKYERHSLRSKPEGYTTQIFEDVDLIHVGERISKAKSRYKSMGMDVVFKHENGKTFVTVLKNPYYTDRPTVTKAKPKNKFASTTNVRRAFWRQSFLKALDQSTTFDAQFAADVANLALAQYDNAAPTITDHTDV